MYDKYVNYYRSLQKNELISQSSTETVETQIAATFPAVIARFSKSVRSETCNYGKHFLVLLTKFYANPNLFSSEYCTEYYR